MRHRGEKRKVSKFFTRAIKHSCLTFKQALQYGQLNAWEMMVAPADRRCTAKIYLHQNSYPPSPPRVCATPHCATSFSHSPLLCLISRSLSSRAPACPRDSDPLNIHSLSSIAPTVLLEEWGEKKKKKRMTLNYSGPNQGYFWRLLRLRRDGAAGSSVCVFWCGSSMSILRCHNCRHYTIMQGSSDAHFSPDDNFLSLPHGCRTSIDQLNHYMMLCKKICSILHTDKQCERPDGGKKKGD